MEYERGDVPIRSVGWVPEQTPDRLPPLTGDSESSVVVIGAGLAGTSVALHLTERGVDVVVLEARQPGDGASGRNAGHVQPYLATLKPTEKWPDQGKRLLDLVTDRRNIVYDLASKHGIACDAANTGMVEAAIRRYGELEHKAREWKQLGYDVEVIGKADLTRLLGSTAYSYGVHWREGGRVNPFLLSQGLAAAAARNGARVYGDSPVIACDREGGRWRVRTRDASVVTDQVVICTNGHGGNPFFPDLAKTQFPLVAYALATKPLPPEVLAAVNPSRVALTQFPVGLYPMVIDERDRIITASIPQPWRADRAEVYFEAALKYLHRTFPVTRDTGSTSYDPSGSFRGCAGDWPRASASGLMRSRKHRNPGTACQKQVSARLPRGMPRRRRSSASSFETNCANSLGTSSVADRRSRGVLQRKSILW